MLTIDKREQFSATRSAIYIFIPYICMYAIYVYTYSTKESYICTHTYRHIVLKKVLQLN